jgi:hypothetical protein
MPVRTDIKVLLPGFYERLENSKDVRCKKCLNVIQLKGSSNYNLVQHLLSSGHSEELKNYQSKLEEAELKEKEKNQEPTAARQPTILESFNRGKPYRKGSEEEKKFHRLTMEMLVDSGLPWALVDKPSFQRLLDYVSTGRAQLNTSKYYRCHLADLDLYETTVARVRAVLRKAEPFISFTTDGWGDTSSMVSLLSLTAHIIMDGKKVKLCLSAIPLKESHTGDYMKERLQECFLFWKIDPKSVASMTHDNESAICKAVRDLVEEGYNLMEDLRCWQHTAELILEEGFKAQKKANDLLACVRRVCNHFSHSIESARQLREIQEKEDHPLLRVKRYTETRWESQLDCMERLLEVEDSLRILCAQRRHSVPYTFSNDDFKYMKSLVSYLRILRELGLELSSDAATLGPMLLFFTRLETAFERRPGEPTGLAAMKAAHRSALDRRLGRLSRSPAYLLSAALDPRVKGRGLGEEERALIRDKLPEWLGRAEAAYASRQPEEEAAAKEGERQEDGAGGGAEPVPKKSRQHTESQLWGSESKESLPEEGGQGWEDQLRRFDAKPRLPSGCDVIGFWFHDKEFPKLRPLALLLATMNPSQVASEQLFSCVGNIVSPNRSNLLPENIEMLAFCQKNLRTFGFEN